jgi:hypothetical protein
MAIDDIADMPSVSYYPSNTTDSREVTWSIVPGTGTAEFVDADGNTVGAWDAKTVVGIKALTAGTVTLTATPTVGGVQQHHRQSRLRIKQHLSIMSVSAEIQDILQQQQSQSRHLLMRLQTQPFLFPA